MRVLVIAPHPDDETIGAGGALARHIALGDEVYWCIVTQGYSPPWSEETLILAGKQIDQVQKIYGFQEVFRLGFPTVKLNTVPHIDLCTAIQKVIKKINPDIVYTSSRNDANLDHRIVYDCTLVALRPLPGNTARRVLSYEIGYTGHFGVPAGASMFLPNVFINITLYMNKKLAAMKCYETELRESPHPRSIEGIKLLARSRGLSFGFEFAECFELVREIL
jgi:LmbE family N-acetylglucosaminyl deacetylase